jgi:hypothetical protein
MVTSTLDTAVATLWIRLDFESCCSKHIIQILGLAFESCGFNLFLSIKVEQRISLLLYFYKQK